MTDPTVTIVNHHQPEGELAQSFRGAVTRMIQAELRGGTSHAPERAAQFVTGDLGSSCRCGVNALGKLVDRLPDALSFAEVCLVLDRFNVALRGHSSFPSVDAYGPESRVASESIVGEASGAVETPSAPASDAPSTTSEAAA